jgi:DnaJ homolog subfamily C member 19
MATPILVGIGALTAGLVGRHLLKTGAIGGKKAAEEWVKGGFKAKMDRKEAIDILGLKCVLRFLLTIS